LGVQGFLAASNTRPHSGPYAAGTDNQAAETPNGAQHLAQYMARETRRFRRSPAMTEKQKNAK